MPVVLDTLDRALLRELQQNARRSYRELARRTRSTTPTVSKRIRRMEGLGIILGYTVRLDEARFQDDATRPGAAPGPLASGPREDAVDVDAPVSLTCHTCYKETQEPVYATVAGVVHPFCCTTCRAAYVEKDARFRKGL